MRVTVSNATTVQIDWMVAKCEGKDYTRLDGSSLTQDCFNPSINWEDGGPIISRERISIRHWTNVPIVHAYMPDSDWSSDGESALVAAMRAYVGSKLGNEVEVPDELIDDEPQPCPTCGEDGGTSCGAINCDY